MKIEYKNTFEECLNYEKLRYKKNKKLSIFLNFVFYAYILILISTIGYFTYIDKSKGKDFWIFTITMLVVIIAWIIVIPKLKMLIHKMGVRHSIKKFPYRIQKRTLEINEEIIRIKNSNNILTTINKNDIEDIIKIENVIYLIPIKEKNTIFPLAIIPLNIFNDDYEKEFLTLLNKFKDIKIKKL